MLNAWQPSVPDAPNALIGAVMFAVLVFCATLTRIAHRAHAFGSGRIAGLRDTAVRSSLDQIICGWWLGIAAMLVVGLR